MFTCGACNVVFLSAEAQREHYKTDWHRYNLKRKVAELAPIGIDVFHEKILQKQKHTESDRDEAEDTKHYCDQCNKKFGSLHTFHNHLKSKKHLEKPQEQTSCPDKQTIPQEVATKPPDPSRSPEVELDPEEWSDVDSEGSWNDEDGLGVEECLFCPFVGANVDDKLCHMYTAHGFFLPDMDYCSDLEGLLIYLGQKVGIGYMCLWCDTVGKKFRTLDAVRKHMIDKCHCKLLHEGEALVELSDFYDYTLMLCSRGCGSKVVGRPVLNTWVRWRFTRWQDMVKDEKEKSWIKRKMRIMLNPKQGTYITYDDFQQLQVVPQKRWEDRTDADLLAATHEQRTTLVKYRYLDFSPSHLRRQTEYERLIKLQYDQRYLPERQLILGHDLAAAHFIVHRGGVVKFFDNPDWINLDGQDNYDLPKHRVNDLYLEAIDAAGTLLLCEGFDNLARLKKLRYLSLAACVYVNDWCMDRVQQYWRSLEYLDLSYCKRLTAAGISALSCLKKLKYLRLEGLDHIEDLGKVALMLEDTIPGLTVVGVDYNKALADVQKDNRLLDEPNVWLDAKNNVHLKDDEGEFYYLKGLKREQHITDEFGLPLYISRIRLEPPEMDPVVVERVNRLCDGKLKHLLIGSPSAEWTRETERLLSFEAYYILKDGKTVHPVMLPECMKHEEKKLGLKDKIMRYLPIGNELETNLPPLALETLPKEEETELELLPEPALDKDKPQNQKLLTDRERFLIEDSSNDTSLIALSDKWKEIVAKRRNVLLPSPDEPISFEIKSQPPKPRPPRLLSKIQRYTADSTQKNH